jgi:hypothetical protein
MAIGSCHRDAASFAAREAAIDAVTVRIVFDDENALLGQSRHSAAQNGGKRQGGDDVSHESLVGSAPGADARTDDAGKTFKA